MKRELWCSLGLTLVVVGLHACGDDSDDENDDDALVTAAPVISSFTASPARLDFGATSTLAWTVDNGTLRVNGETVTGTSLAVTPTTTTVFTLTATNGVGTTTAEVTIAVSSTPSAPLAYTADAVLTYDSGFTNYVTVPASYDPTHQTPIHLFVWLHGCGGYSQYDVYNVSPGGAGQTWITLAPGGAENGCWSMSNDPSTVRNALTELRKHFNIDPKRVVLGGYSSGGDLAYRMAFYDSLAYAGVLATNTSPFRDTGASQSDSLAAATWKFNVYHLAHIGDTTYPIAGVRAEFQALVDAGYPAVKVEVEGNHYDDAGEFPGTDADIRSYLLPRLSEGWVAP